VSAAGSRRVICMCSSVAEKGNMAKAAEQLAISRPVVSKTIADLEHTLGVRLLDRTPRGVEPTLYGRALLKRSLAVFDELRQSVKEIEFLTDPTAGELRVGFSEIPASGLVPAAIDRLSRQYRNMTVQTEQGTFGTLLDFLRSRRCEVVVTRLLAREPERRAGAPRSAFYRRGCSQQVGAPTPDHACRSRRGALGAGATGDGAGQPDLGSLSCSGTIRSARRRVKRLYESALRSSRYGALHHDDSGLSTALRRSARLDPDIACQSSALACADMCFDSQGPHLESVGTTLHRLPARAREAARPTRAEGKLRKRREWGNSLLSLES
jgi:molybdenum-dependent DNA-binding transcriptional regulator ModE